ncbi:MAG: protein-ADP-ribose hydrolase [Oscillospiraceae bacterium]|nr:protein-ADP-ribose hydrolase [Oscillospiraceae bacterium]
MTQSERLEYLINYLLQERRLSQPLPTDDGERFRLFRALVNTREPIAASAEFLSVQDEYLTAYIAEQGITHAGELPRCPSDNRISIWQGDITLLDADAIVNAANSAMLGCWVPNHACIDNCIHTFAGVQLRMDCSEIMTAQGHDEPTGMAKITPAYSLPSRYVLHTVGPIISSSVSANDRELLASSYRSCFELAEEKGLESIAYCCISTGVFRFPNDLAAEIAVKTVRECLDNAKSVKHVIFNVFKDVDKMLYENILG